MHFLLAGSFGDGNVLAYARTVAEWVAFMVRQTFQEVDWTFTR